MQEIARIPVVWIGSGAEEDPYRPGLLSFFSLNQSDVTGQPSPSIPTAPPGYTVEVRCDSTVIDAIQVNPNYGSWATLWIERADGGPGRRPKTAVPNDNEFNSVRNYLRRLGMSTAQIDEAIGTAVGGRTREQLTQALIDWQKLRPRGEPQRRGKVYILRGTGQVEVAEG